MEPLRASIYAAQRFRESIILYSNEREESVMKMDFHSEKLDEERLVNYLERICLSLEIIADSISDIIALTSSDTNMNLPNQQTYEFEYEKNNDNDEFVEGSVDVESNIVDDNQYLKQYLEDRRIDIKDFSKVESNDQTLDKLSDFIGNRYEMIKPLLDAIKRNMVNGKTFKLSIKNYSDDAISSMCQLSTSLYEIAMLKSYSYKRAPACVITAQTNTVPKVQNFLSGGWLERYIANSIKEIMERIQLQYDVKYRLYRNVQILLPNNRTFEMDILLFIKKDVCYWFECKSGSYQDRIFKYSDICQKYSFCKDRSYIVLTTQDSKIYNSNGLYSISPIKINEFKGKIEEILIADCETQGIKRFEADEVTGK